MRRRRRRDAIRLAPRLVSSRRVVGNDGCPHSRVYAIRVSERMRARVVFICAQKSTALIAETVARLPARALQRLVLPRKFAKKARHTRAQKTEIGVAAAATASARAPTMSARLACSR